MVFVQNVARIGSKVVAIVIKETSEIRPEKNSESEMVRGGEATGNSTLITNLGEFVFSRQDPGF
jgi:hypothetical protein